MPLLFQRWTSVLAALALGLSLAVAAARIHTSWRAAGIAPGTAETSGCEEESWLSLWNRLHDRPALREVTTAPFNYAYFNWAFYESYATALNWVDAGEHPVRLIRGGRLITTAWVLLGLVALAALLRRAGPRDGSWVGALFWAGLAVVGPLAGWFVTTVRPDPAAITLEILGLSCIWQVARRTDAAAWGFAALGGLCVYGAWAFKPSFIGVMSGIGLFLLLQRRWRSLAVYCAVVWGCTGLTFLLGGSDYREIILGTIFQFSRFDAGTGWGAAKHAVAATSPLTGALLVLLVGLWRFPAKRPAPDGVSSAPAWFNSPAVLLGVCCILVTLPLNAAAAFKVGAWSYYYLPVLPSACLIAVALLPHTRLATLATAVAAGLTITLQSGLLAGTWGSISRTAAARELQACWQEFSTLPEPRFSDDLRLNLPWLNPGSPPYLLAYDYAALREAGLAFDGDGFGGAIRRGDLATLYLRPPARTHFDGASLEDFTLREYPTGFIAYFRPDVQPPALPKPPSP